MRPAVLAGGGILPLPWLSMLTLCHFRFFNQGVFADVRVRAGSEIGVPPRGRKLWPAMLCLTAVLLGATGCSSFDHAWRAAGKSPEASDSIAGRWQGTWRSDANGHADELRCLLTPLTNGFYSARYHARYRRGLFRFSFGYTASLSVRRGEGSSKFEGRADLGWLAGGAYRYKGTVSATNFFSTYDSKYDRGVFQMTRPR